jgi:hypothetical protein
LLKLPTKALCLNLGEPIVVLHVALTTEISNNIASLVKHHRKISKSASLDVESSSSFSALESNKSEDPALCTTGKTSLWG